MCKINFAPLPWHTSPITRCASNDMKACVTFICKTFGRLAILQKLLKSMKEMGYEGYNIVIINDATLPDVPGFIEAEQWIVSQPNIRYKLFPEPLGIGLGRNEAVALVTTPYFVQLDDDFIFTADTNISKMFNILQTTDITLVGGSIQGKPAWTGTLTVTHIDNKPQLSIINQLFYNISHYDEHCFQADTVINFFMADTEQIRGVGGWDSTLMYNEHTDFFMTLKLEGLKTLSCNDIRLIHEDNQGFHIKSSIVKNKSKYLTQFLNKRGLAKYVSCSYPGQSECVGAHCWCRKGNTFDNKMFQKGQNIE